MSRLSMDIQLSAAIQWEAAGIMSPQAWSAHTINYQLAATLEKHSLLFNQRVVFFRTSFPNSFRISTFTSINVFFCNTQCLFLLMRHDLPQEGGGRAQWGCSGGGWPLFGEVTWNGGGGCQASPLSSQSFHHDCIAITLVDNNHG